MVYCRSGNRSAKAAQKLVKLGYTHVYDFGGINDWPYEIEK
ncbi:MAG: rhodanese-like domain-containing protein [Coprobacillus cateniformis]